MTIPVHYSFKNIWKIAFPIILGSIAQDLITLVDTAFVGRLGETELGAVAIGAIFYLTIVMLAWGFGIGIQIIIARRFGENNYNAINATFYHAFWILLLMSIAVFSLLHFSNANILNRLIENKNILDESIQFMDIRIWGLFAAFININFRAFYIGTSNTKIIGYTTILMAVVNISLDYILIFGKAGFPSMGIKGAALASVIAEFTATIYFSLASSLGKKNRNYKLLRFQPFQRELLDRLFRVATPTTIQHFISFSAWFLFFLLVEKMGEIPLAISNIIRSLYIIMILPIFGFSSATNTLVSFAIGRNESQYLGVIIKRSLLMSLSGVIVLTSISFLIPEKIIGLFTNLPELIEATKPAYFVVMIAAYSLSIGFILFQAVSGTGKTAHALIIESIVIVFYLLGVFIISKNENSTVQQVWIMEIFYGILLSLFSALYLKYVNWNKKNRI